MIVVQTTITSPGVLGGWVSADPSNGTLAAGQSQAISVKYDVSQNEFQGIYSADILITTNAQPLAKVNPLWLQYYYPGNTNWRVVGGGGGGSQAISVKFDVSQNEYLGHLLHRHPHNHQRPALGQGEFLWLH
jgi:hypothetical protein